jgi:transcriptional regulator with XRE-family HTH domain
MNSPIKELRETLKLKQIEMAREAGVSQAHISEVEHCLAGINDKLIKFLEQNNFDVGKIREQQDACILEHENIVKANLKSFLVPKSNE